METKWKTYGIILVTANEVNAETNADIWVRIHAVSGLWSHWVLCDDPDPTVNDFERGFTDTYLFDQADFNDERGFTGIELAFRRRGDGPGWKWASWWVFELTIGGERIHFGGNAINRWIEDDMGEVQNAIRARGAEHIPPTPEQKAISKTKQPAFSAKADITFPGMVFTARPAVNVKAPRARKKRAGKKGT